MNAGARPGAPPAVEAARVLSSSPEMTARLGEALAGALGDGDVLALVGDLGAGKTAFVAGLARGFGCAARVRSPSFSLVNEYHGRSLLLHLDLYRVEPGEIEGLGLDEYAARGALAVEWGEKLPARWLDDALVLRFAPVSESGRQIDGEARGGRGRDLLERWRAICAAPPAA